MTATKKKILILTERSLHNGPRIIREIEALKNDFQLFATGRTAPLDNKIHYFSYTSVNPLPIKILNAIGRKLFVYKLTSRVLEIHPTIEKFILKHKFDIVIIHEPGFLPFLIKLKKKWNFKIVYNAHEYQPLEFDHNPDWLNKFGRYNYALYKMGMPHVDLLINVCDGIALKCQEEFEKTSLIIPNAAFFSNIPIVNNSGPIRMIYHGGILMNRKIEEMIKVAAILGPSYQLDIMAVVQPAQEQYYKTLQVLANEAGNVNFVEPVPYAEITPFINQYDLGLYLLASDNFNDRHALPNKLFEFIQAKLAIAISPSPEMKKVVEKYQLGVVADDFTPQNLASKIAQLTREDIYQFKQNAVMASAQESAEHYSQAYLQAVKQLAGEH